MERFTKIRHIGKGNMGACALARDNEDGKMYVVKQVDLTKLNKKERQQSLNEAKVLSSLRHPNIINYTDSFLAKKTDHLCIVMEFADGGDLSGKIKHQRGVNFKEFQVLDLFIQCVLSLQYTHKRKILHRDVKTQNIFVTQEGLCKLGDYGIAKSLANTFDQAKTFVGTPYYLSPELILERPYDHMSDVWALGVVLYELMALRHPFNANDMKSLMHRILRLQYDPPPTCYSPELRGLVGRLLVKDPNQRMHLSDVLEQPVVKGRIMQWLKGGILPTQYINSLVRNKLLPPSILGEVPAERTTATHLPALSATNGGQSQLHHIPAPPPAHQQHPPAPAYQQYLSGIPVDAKLKPKPHRLSDALASGLPGGPSVDHPPTRQEPMMRAPPIRQEIPAGIPFAPKLPSMGRGHLPSANPRSGLPAMPTQLGRPGALGPVRTQPSVRPLPYAPQGANDVQSAIQHQPRPYNRFGR